MKQRLLVLLCALLAACSPRAAGGKVELPGQIVPPSRAYDVRPERKADGSIAVTYRLREPFPADGELGRIRGALPAPEWHPLPHDWLNPDITTSLERGWAGFTDRTKSPPTRVQQWSAQWRDAHGNIVFYQLRYDSAARPGTFETAPPDNDEIRVAAAWFPKDAAERLMKWSTTVPRGPGM